MGKRGAIKRIKEQAMHEVHYKVQEDHNRKPSRVEIDKPRRPHVWNPKNQGWWQNVKSVC